jgi:hypothetical protein
MEEALGVPDLCQRLREAQVRVHVHQADLAAEEGRAFGALEVALRAAVVIERPIEQARAVGAHQVLVDQAQVVLQLRRDRTGPRGSRGSSRGCCSARRVVASRGWSR